jgi:hypothetical protein
MYIYTYIFTYVQICIIAYIYVYIHAYIRIAARWTKIAENKKTVGKKTAESARVPADLSTQPFSFSTLYMCAHTTTP